MKHAFQSDPERLLSAIRADAQQQHSFHSPTIQPLARVAAAARIASAPRSADDPIWNDVPDIGPFLLHDPANGLSTDTEAKAAFDDTNLYVRVFNRGGPARSSFKQEFWMVDTAEIFIDGSHDHFHFLQFCVMPDGSRKGFNHWKSWGTQRSERRGKTDEVGADHWSAAVHTGVDHWTVLFTIPFKTLGIGVSEARPIGFNVLRQRCDTPWEHYYWNFTHRTIQAPFAFGDLYLGAPPRIHVERVDLGELRLWENRGALHIRNLSDAAIDAVLEVAVNTGPKEEHSYHRSRTEVRIPARSSEPFLCPLVFPLDQREFKYHHLHLTLEAADATRLWRGSFRVGYEHGWMVHLDDRREGPIPSDPAPQDSDFIAKKRAFIQRRIPRFVRKTTAQGAPSDFTLEASDGPVQFNLMRAGALQQMADFIYSRYDTDLDRLLGATMFMHQHAVIAYAHAPSGITAVMSPLSIIRMGNTICSMQAEAMIGLLRKMKCAATGKPYHARAVTFFAHVAAAVEFGGKWVHLDPSLGRFHFLPGNKVLASMEELIANPELARPQSDNLVEMLKKTAGDLPFYSDASHGIWPPGAPEE